MIKNKEIPLNDNIIENGLSEKMHIDETLLVQIEKINSEEIEITKINIEENL